MATKNAEVSAWSATLVAAGRPQLARRCFSPLTVVRTDPRATIAPAPFSTTNMLYRLCTSSPV
jgi:hypothetical protein